MQPVLQEEFETTIVTFFSLRVKKNLTCALSFPLRFSTFFLACSDVPLGSKLGVLVSNGIA